MAKSQSIPQPRHRHGSLAAAIKRHAAGRDGTGQELAGVEVSQVGDPTAPDQTWGPSWLPPTSWHRSSVGAWQDPRP